LIIAGVWRQKVFEAVVEQRAAGLLAIRRRRIGKMPAEPHTPMFEYFCLQLYTAFGKIE
jgi:hypothetical protein